MQPLSWHPPTCTQHNKCNEKSTEEDAVEWPSVNTSVDVMCGLSDLIIAQNFLGSNRTVARFEKDVLAVQSLETMLFRKVFVQ